MGEDGVLGPPNSWTARRSLPSGRWAHGGAFLVAVNSAGPSPRVVIVDESVECREVLHTLLANRGVSAIAARGAREGLELMRQHHPDVVVLDLDAHEADDDGLRDALDLEASEQHTALVVLGKARRYLEALPDGQVLAKPYHYAPLLRTIERLLDR